MNSDRPIRLEPGVLLWRQVLHLPTECIPDPSVVPTYGPKHNIFRIQTCPDFLFEPELRGGIFRGLIAFVHGPTPEEWTHARVLQLRNTAVDIEILPPMPGYLKWRYDVRKAILSHRGRFFDRAEQIQLMRDMPPIGVEGRRLWTTWTDSELIS